MEGIYTHVCACVCVCVYLENEMTTQSRILAWEIPRTEEHGVGVGWGGAGYSSWGRKESDTTEQLNNNKCMCVCVLQEVGRDLV